MTTKNIQLFSHSTVQRVKVYAFTLAETLIVIGIIGVVAALTLPNLNHATGDKEKVTKVKKIYSALTDAVDRAQVIYGPCDEWANGIGEDEDINERYIKRITEFMKVSKDCGYDDGCWSTNDLIRRTGDSFTDSGNSGYSVMLTDGMALTAWVGDVYRIRIDIDGPQKGKKQVGNDIFDFSVYLDDDLASAHGAQKNMVYPAYWPNLWTEWAISESYGNYTTAWVVQHGNLDYLKCPNDLNWETKTSCE